MILQRWLDALASLIPFPAEVLPHLYEQYNAWLWPGQLIWGMLNAAILAWLIRGNDRPWQVRVVCSVLAAAWLLPAIGLYGKFLTPLNWGMHYLVAVLLVQAAALGFAGLWLAPRWERRRGRGKTFAVFLFFAAIVVPIQYPSPAGWNQLLLAGWGANNTALATLALLLAFRGSRLLALFACIPLLWLIGMLVVGLTLASR